ncbi:type I restriction endonuclease subunit R [Halorubrum ezzemoulense]|uniref:type I restriction endonuclease subunit R n=1 Tax=Halorubrum ezzemoulense TaxID=337243 RepID=UPI00232C718E|nr:type I restriction endonuclease subunit R [Halorubrum ezzemoulense]MDB9247918.1 type I restriction endonuclease subunit R [Halorubrum ezzemoulense]MDB9258173.1 type I restriction endonuclease subunit R [Halorubrum ezzemoulense]MDB9261465.1 type I restriction endonuclease subunit R [Halorubrum ezzemoulense]MDB9264968.1 type I restriction endonuclease subunit R [Halorubrum ezzemoulense]MDB9268534.1 type I restriction endonuclease subunit R [Halorubrum ezzemoulense]
MVSVPNEGGVERSLLSWLDAVGWETHGQDGSRGASVLDGKYDRRSNEVIYWNLLKEQIIKINDEITEDNADRFLNSLRRELDYENLLEGNQNFHELLSKGKTFGIENARGGNDTVYVDLIDFDPDTFSESNRFHAVNQFSVSRGATIRPDVTLFVNGIPLVTMELKSLAQDNDYYDAISDLHQYEEDVPRMFIPGLFNVAADTMEFRYGSVGAPDEFYELWNEAPEQYADENNPMKQAVQALCNPATLVDVLKNFVFFEKRAGGDAKIIPRYTQYYAVNRILDRVREGVHDRGLIWHTQGSGKSFTMLYAAENLLSRSEVARNPQVFIIVDTDKLNSQMRDQLSNLSLAQWTEAKSIDHLQELIEEGSSQLVLTTIQKFQDVEPDTQGNDEVIVMSDEAHRFMEADLGSRLDAALPNSSHFGFTGTPVREGEREKDRNTFTEFSPEGEDYLHRYSVKQGIEDGLILPVYFTLRHEMEWEVSEDALDEKFEREFRGMTTEEKREFISDNVTSRTMAELEPRVDRAVEEIDAHYEEKVAPNGWKGMVVTPSRRSAAMYGERLREIRGEDAVEVLYTSTNDDPDLIQKFHTDPEERDSIVERFKEPDEAPSLLVVHNMLLTGFDAPILKTMYLDRNLKDHNLLQAIARTNRPADGKQNGEIVDFQGVFENIDDALDYDTETKAYAARDEEELFADLVDQLDTVMEIFDGIPKDDSQEATNAAVSRISKHPERREFKQGFRRLQNLYESVAPDGRLIKEGIQDQYQWLSRIQVAFERTTSGKEAPEDDMREKTRRIINENVDVGEIRDDFPTYKLGGEILEEVEGLDNPGVKASQIAHATQDHLHPRTGQNPRYKRLSERVTEIVERWQGGDVSDPEAVEALKSVEGEVLEVEEEAGDDAAERARFAIETHLTEELDGEFESGETASEIADSIVNLFEDEVDREYPGWETNESTEQDIETVILDVIALEYDRPDLIDDQLVDAVREYLINNYA